MISGDNVHSYYMYHISSYQDIRTDSSADNLLRECLSRYKHFLNKICALVAVLISRYLVQYGM